MFWLTHSAAGFSGIIVLLVCIFKRLFINYSTVTCQIRRGVMRGWVDALVIMVGNDQSPLLTRRIWYVW